MKSLIGKKAIYKSPYSGFDMEVEILKECYDIFCGETPCGVLSKNEVYYPIHQIKIINQ